MGGSSAEGEVGIEEVEAGHLSSVRATLLKRRRQGESQASRTRSQLMAVAFQTQSFIFPLGDGPRTETLTFPFSSSVKEAACAVSGFRFDFGDQGAEIPSADVVQVVAKVLRRSGSTVQVSVRAHFDVKERNAQYSGQVDVLAIAEL
jgi:hypothetical protein